MKKVVAIILTTMLLLAFMFAYASAETKISDRHTQPSSYANVEEPLHFHQF